MTKRQANILMLKPISAQCCNPILCSRSTDTVRASLVLALGTFPFDFLLLLLLVESLALVTIQSGTITSRSSFTLSSGLVSPRSDRLS